MENFAQSLLNQIADQTTIIRFFAVFSRFEYSLKRANYVKCGSGVEANWDKFASELKTHFKQDASPELQMAINYLNERPPKKEVSPGEWREMSRASNEPLLTWLVRVVRQIRNNLFHGGKYSTSSVRDPARQKELLESACQVLEECLCLDAEPAKKVRRYFEEEI